MTSPIHWPRAPLVGLVLLLVLAATPAWAGFTLVGHVGAQSGDGNSTTTAGLNTTGATLLVLSAAWVYSGSATISDSKGNTWTPLTGQVASPQCQVQLFYVVNPTVGTGHTFTVSGTTIFPAVTVTAWTGQAASPVDQQNGNTATATTVATGSVTPSQSNELLIATTCHNNQYTSSINSSFTISDDENGMASFAYGNVMAYLVQGSASAVNPTFSGNGSSNTWAAAIATFKAAGGAPPRAPCMGGGGFMAPGCSN
jgi:hypothetical protein